MKRERVYHITTNAEVQSARESNRYLPTAFDREGFIHCSYRRQVMATANRIFRGREDLVLLEIDLEQLSCPVLDENLEGGCELYPHIYGPLPMAAVIAVHPLSPDADGSFSLPVALTSTAIRT